MCKEAEVTIKNRLKKQKYQEIQAITIAEPITNV